MTVTLSTTPAGTRARRATGDWIESGGTSLPAPSRFLSLHHHSHNDTAAVPTRDVPDAWTPELVQ